MRLPHPSRPGRGGSHQIIVRPLPSSPVAAGVVWFPACSPWGQFQRIKVHCPEPVPIPMPFAALVQRIRSFSLSIGQLTFGSFLLLLAVITATSMASVIAIRHIDQTFAELQRVQSVGDLAEDIDRRMNELRL